MRTNALLKCRLGGIIGEYYRLLKWCTVLPLQMKYDPIDYLLNYLFRPFNYFFFFNVLMSHILSTRTTAMVKYNMRSQNDGKELKKMEKKIDFHSKLVVRTSFAGVHDQWAVYTFYGKEAMEVLLLLLVPCGHSVCL